MDELGNAETWAPYVAPHQAGTGALILSLSSNPGPATHRESGSAFISCENDDGSAARMCALYEGAGIPQKATVPWNAYPWFLHDELSGEGLKKSHIEEGLRPLKGLLDLLPDLAVIMLHGNDAKSSWSRFLASMGHTSVNATWSPSRPGTQATALSQPTESSGWPTCTARMRKQPNS